MRRGVGEGKGVRGGAPPAEEALKSSDHPEGVLCSLARLASLAPNPVPDRRGESKP
ncbi:MAG: hypothetical protein VYA46_07150 [Verrucomicrobiota bacterium]|nr:hypothetical protein [Verrucomicrobiota bacterium]